MSDARAIAEQTARASYGRLLAWLSARTRDVAAAEDALADAFRAALENWPEKGVPDAPEAWLLTAARRKLIDHTRRRKTRTDAVPALALAAEEAEAAARDESAFPDERLKLLFICAHPAISESVRTPLMLQTVLGLDAARIASAFLISPTAMSGRLVRAKRKIKSAGIPFEPPDIAELPDRLSAVLDSIYAAFGAGWDDVGGAETDGRNLTREAIYLAELVTTLLPDEAENWGLLSLMLHAEARKKARRNGDRYVTLEEQDIDLWDREMIASAEAALARAWSLGHPGPYQIEAAIQSAHAAFRLHNRDTKEDVVLLYQKLLELAPTVGARVGYAAALARAGDCEAGLKLLNTIEAERIDRYQAYWAVKAHIFDELGRTTDAQQAYDRAIGLSQEPAVRHFLLAKKTKSDGD